MLFPSKNPKALSEAAHLWQCSTQLFPRLAPLLSMLLWYQRYGQSTLQRHGNARQGEQCPRERHPGRIQAPHPCRPPHGKASFLIGRWTCTRTGKKLNETKWSIIRMAIKAEGRSKAVNSINSANKCSGMILLCSEPARGRCCLLSFAY